MTRPPQRMVKINEVIAPQSARKMIESTSAKTTKGFANILQVNPEVVNHRCEATRGWSACTRSANSRRCVPRGNSGLK